MQVLIRHDDFLTEHYEIRINDTALEFIGENNVFALPYPEVKDFCITKNKREKVYFTMLYSDGMLEGQVLEPEESEPFAAQLKERLDGVITIEVRK